MAPAKPPPLLYLFGLPGAGKNFVGELCAAERSDALRFYDADEWLLPDMVAALAAGKGFTPGMRDRYYAEVSAQIGRLKQAELAKAQAPRSEGAGAAATATCTLRGLVVAQATFKACHRREIVAAHPEAQLWWVRTSDETTRMQRLRERGSVVDDALGKKLCADFEAPRTALSVTTECGDRSSEAPPSGDLDLAQPTHSEADGCHAVIVNDGDELALREQLQALLSLALGEGAADLAAAATDSAVVSPQL